MLRSIILNDKLIPKGPQRPKRAFIILDRLTKLDSKPDSCEILHNCVLPRVLINKAIFIKNTRIINLICLFLEMQFYSDIAVKLPLNSRAVPIGQC